MQDLPLTVYGNPYLYLWFFLVFTMSTLLPLS